MNSRHRHRLTTLRKRYGGAVSNVLADPSCATFEVPQIDGVIAYRQGLGCHVSIGDPVAPEDAAVALAERFRISGLERGLSTLIACASDGLAHALIDRGYAAVEFGEELVIDPARDPQAGRRGRELRKKVARAEREGLVVAEYRPEHDSGHLAPQMEAVAQSWLAARKGPQTYVAPVLLFAERGGRRWFYARQGLAIVGVISLVRLDARDGWLIEHLLSRPGAPPGTSEVLVTSALAALGDEGCGYATFGPSPREQLGTLHRVEGCSEVVVRALFDISGRLFAFGARSRYRQKFQPIRSEPSYLLFHPTRFGLREATGLLRAFNLSLPTLSMPDVRALSRGFGREDASPPSSRAA